MTTPAIDTRPPNPLTGRLTRPIEPRKPTEEPLVEIEERADGSDGENVPTGRRKREAPAVDGNNDALPYDDALSSFGLNADEVEMFNAASARHDAHVAGKEPPAPSDYMLHAEREELAAQGISKLASESSPASIDTEAANRFLAEYRIAHPWPASFHALPIGHPSNNLAPFDDEEPSGSVAQETPVAAAPLAAPLATPLAPSNPLVSISKGGPEVPDGHAVISDIPPQIAEHLPPGTLITQALDSSYHAHVPSGETNETVTVRGRIGAALHHLVADIEAGLAALRRTL